MLFIFIFLSSLNCYASNEVFFKHVNSEKGEFEEFVSAVGGQDFETYFLEKRKESQQRLIDQYIIAKRAFLNGERKVATKKFEEIEKQWLADDWTPESADLFVSTSLYLLELQPQARMELIQSLSRYPLDSVLKIARVQNFTLMPNELEVLRKQIPTEIEIELPGKGLLFINGTQHESDSLHLRPGLNRIHYISNEYQAQVRLIDPRVAKVVKIQTQPIAKGNCLDPVDVQVPSELAKRARVFVSPNCQLELTAQGWRTNVPLTQQLLSQSVRPKSFWVRNKTLIVISSIVASGILINHVNSNFDVSVRPLY